MSNDREQVLPPRRTEFKRFGIGRGGWMKLIIAINGRDHTSFRESSSSIDDRPIIDKQSRCVDEEALGFWSSIGFWSNGRDVSRSPSIRSNLSRYNSGDRQLWLTHLRVIWSTCVFLDRVDLVSTASTQSVNRGLDPTCGVLPRHPEIKINEMKSSHKEEIKGINRVYKVCGYHTISKLSSDYWKTYILYKIIYIYSKYKYTSMCHIRATQASARVHVA